MKTFKKSISEKTKLPRQIINPSKEAMIVKNNKVIVIDKKDLKQYTSKGWSLAEKNDINENRYMRGGVRLSFDDDRFGGKKMMIQIGTDTLDVPNSQIKNFLKLIRGLSDSEFK